MIVEFFYNLAASLVSWICSLMPDWDVPGWATSVGPNLQGFFNFASGMSPWFDFVFLAGCLGAYLAAYGIGFAITLVRKVVGYIPGEAGSAA